MRFVGALLAEAEELLAFYRFPAAYWSKLHSTNNIDRVEARPETQPFMDFNSLERPLLVRLTGVAASTQALASPKDEDAPFVYKFLPQARCNMCAAVVADHARTLGKRLGRHQGIRPRNGSGVTTTIQRCTKCGLIFANPMPIPNDLGQHYDIPVEKYWTRDVTVIDTTVADTYFADEINQFQRLRQTTGLTPTVLDVGAGVGRAMVQLSKAGFDVFGLEPSPAFHEFALTQNGISPDRLSLTSLEDADYPDETFDLITFGAVLEHLADPATCLEQTLSWLCPEGLIHIEVPSSDWLMARLLDLVYRIQGLDYTTHLSPMHVPFHLYEFTLVSFERHGERAGYEIAHHRRFVASTFVPTWLDWPLRQIMQRSGTGMQLEVWLRRPASHRP